MWWDVRGSNPLLHLRLGMMYNIQMSNIGRTPRPLADRFWEKVKKTDGCWLWTGAIRKISGYGAFQVGVRKTVGAHRVAFELTIGRQIPKGVHVLHTCDVRHCVRPDHLWDGTAADNMHDMVKKGRAATGDKNGSRLHPDRRPRGEDNRKAKLRTKEIKRIRRAYATGEITQIHLGEQYGVSQAQIQRIVAGTSWAHVSEDE